MNKYQQMSEAAATAKKSYLDYRERVWGCFAAIVNGLIEGCGVPQEHIIYMKWDGTEEPEGHFAVADDDAQYTLPGAIAYDRRDNSFNLGVLIYLTPANHMPRQRVTFGLWITEKNGATLIQLGRDGKSKPVSLRDEAARNAFCNEIAQKIVEAFEFPLKENQKPIGFDIGTLGS